MQCLRCIDVIIVTPWWIKQTNKSMNQCKVLQVCIAAEGGVGGTRRAACVSSPQPSFLGQRRDILHLHPERREDREAFTTQRAFKLLSYKMKYFNNCRCHSGNWTRVWGVGEGEAAFCDDQTNQKPAEWLLRPFSAQQGFKKPHPLPLIASITTPLK